MFQVQVRTIRQKTIIGISVCGQLDEWIYTLTNLLWVIVRPSQTTAEGCNAIIHTHKASGQIDRDVVHDVILAISNGTKDLRAYYSRARRHSRRRSSGEIDLSQISKKEAGMPSLEDLTRKRLDIDVMGPAHQLNTAFIPGSLG